MRRGMAFVTFILLCAEPVQSQQSSDTSYCDPDIPLIVAGNVYSIVHGRRALCQIIAPDSVSIVDQYALKFRSDFPTLVPLAESSEFWEKARESSERSNKLQIETTPAELRAVLAENVCRTYTDYLFVGQPEAQSELAQRWIKILQHWKQQPSNRSIERDARKCGTRPSSQR